MLMILAPAAKSIVCTTAPGARAMTAEEIAALAAALGLQADVIADPVAAVRHACGEGRLVVVAGSIFLIGLVREWLAHDILR
jgi:folylpolyglutamate synthase/dihydropteroate synthase